MESPATVDVRGQTWSLQIVCNPPEEMLADIYITLKGQGLLERYWPESVPSLSDFLNWREAGHRNLISCLTARESGEIVNAGIGAVEIHSVGSSHSRADVSAIFQREFQHPAFTKEFSKIMIDAVFQDVPKLRVMAGMIPVVNRAAIIYARRLGFRLSGPIDQITAWEGAPSAAVIATLTREAWADGAKQRREEGHSRTQGEPGRAQREAA